MTSQKSRESPVGVQGLTLALPYYLALKFWTSQICLVPLIWSFLVWLLLTHQSFDYVSLTDYFVAWRSEVEKVMKFASTRSNHLNYPYVVKSYPLLDKNWKPLYGNQTVQLRMNLITELDEQK